MGVCVECDVLVVDDDPTIREMITQVLTDEGYTVCGASQGQMALDLARINHPRVVIMDLMMPLLDGAEAIRRLKADPETQAIRTILTSAAPGLPLRAADAPADALLPKPFELSVLCDLVSTHLALTGRATEPAPST